MSQQAVEQIRWDFFSRLPIDVEVRDVQVSSDAGILPIRQFDDQIGYAERFIACLNDVRPSGVSAAPPYTCSAYGAMGSSPYDDETRPDCEGPLGYRSI